MHMDDKCECLDRVFHAVHTKLFDKVREGVDSSLGYSHLFLLKYISKKEGCTVTEIASHLNVTLSAVTGLANKLFQMKLVERIRNDGDRRIVVIKITSEGKAVINKLESNQRKVFMEYFSDITEAEINTFFKVIEKINDRFLMDIS